MNRPGACSQAIAITARQKILLIYGLQYQTGRCLQQFVFQGGYPQRPGLTIGLGNALPSYQLGSISLLSQFLNQLSDVFLQVRLVLLIRDLINTAGSLLVQALKHPLKVLLVE
jgi:hypothetical protein